MKRVFLAILCCVLLIGSIPVASFAAMGGGEIAVPLYNNTLKINGTFVINDSGVATLNASCIGIANKTERITITTKIEKMNSNGSWSIVDIGTENNVWIDTSTNPALLANHTATLSHGTYRAVFDYVVSGSGGADDVDQIIVEKTY